MHRPQSVTEQYIFQMWAHVGETTPPFSGQCYIAAKTALRAKGKMSGAIYSGVVILPHTL